MNPQSQKVFISYATPDERDASRLRDELVGRGIQTFFAPEDIRPGGNFPAKLSAELAASDYFVLLLSAASANRPWVTEEWSAALVREINEHRAFLFLLRLDTTHPPALLASRNCIDAFQNWPLAVNKLVGFWERDWKERKRDVRVVPAPALANESNTRDTIGLYIFNRSFSVQHFMNIVSTSSGRQLYARVKAALLLKDRVDMLEGQIGLTFRYSLVRYGQPIPEESEFAPELADGETLELVITALHFAPGNVTSQSYRVRSDGSTLPPKTMLHLLRQAFAHLLH